MNKPSFSINILTNEQTGDLMAVYFQIRKGKAAEVREFAEGAAFANYAKNGELLGIELLGPCRLAVLDKIAKESHVKRFIRKGIPRQMELARS
jgi:hypothetical protein